MMERKGKEREDTNNAVKYVLCRCWLEFEHRHDTNIVMGMCVCMYMYDVVDNTLYIVSGVSH